MKPIAPILKVFSESFNLFHHQKPNHSNAGWQRLDMSAYRKWKIRSWRQGAPVRFIRPKATFGLTPNEYKKLKGLKRENLRDHMDDFELIFNMLGERSTTEIHRQENSKGVTKLKQDANRGGKVAGNARKELEKELGRSVVTKQNFLDKPEAKKSLNR